MDKVNKTGFIERLLDRLRPDLRGQPAPLRSSALADLLSILGTLPFVLLGLAWLALVTR